MPRRDTDQSAEHWERHFASFQLEKGWNLIEQKAIKWVKAKSIVISQYGEFEWSGRSQSFLSAPAWAQFGLGLRQCLIYLREEEATQSCRKLLLKAEEKLIQSEGRLKWEENFSSG